MVPPLLPDVEHRQGCVSGCLPRARVANASVGRRTFVMAIVDVKFGWRTENGTSQSRFFCCLKQDKGPWAMGENRLVGRMR